MSEVAFRKILAFFIAMLLLAIGLHGKPGSYLAAIMDAGAMEQTNP